MLVERWRWGECLALQGRENGGAKKVTVKYRVDRRWDRPPRLDNLGPTGGVSRSFPTPLAGARATQLHACIDDNSAHRHNLVVSAAVTQ